LKENIKEGIDCYFNKEEGSRLLLTSILLRMKYWLYENLTPAKKHFKVKRKTIL